jgi:hypothetical protein
MIKIFPILTATEMRALNKIVFAGDFLSYLVERSLSASVDFFFITYFVLNTTFLHSFYVVTYPAVFHVFFHVNYVHICI